MEYICRKRAYDVQISTNILSRLVHQTINITSDTKGVGAQNEETVHQPFEEDRTLIIRILCLLL
jgi:hypothetical protein